jgi:hypothetical protein
MLMTPPIAEFPWLEVVSSVISMRSTLFRGTRVSKPSRRTDRWAARRRAGPASGSGRSADPAQRHALRGRLGGEVLVRRNRLKVESGAGHRRLLPRVNLDLLAGGTLTLAGTSPGAARCAGRDDDRFEQRGRHQDNLKSGRLREAPLASANPPARTTARRRPRDRRVNCPSVPVTVCCSPRDAARDDDGAGHGGARQSWTTPVTMVGRRPGGEYGGETVRVGPASASRLCRSRGQQ